MAPGTAPASPSPSSIKLSSLIRRTHAPHKIQKKLSYSSSSSTFEEEEGNKLLSLVNIYKRAEYTVAEEEDYGDLLCEQCGSGEQPEELLLCDKCDNGFHMKCVRPIVVRVPIGPWICPKCSDVKVKKLKSKRLKLCFCFGFCFCFCFSGVIVIINVALFLSLF